MLLLGVVNSNRKWWEECRMPWKLVGSRVAFAVGAQAS